MLMLYMTEVISYERPQHDSITIFRCLVFFKKYTLPILPINCLYDTEFLCLDSLRKKNNNNNIAALASSLTSSIKKYCDKLSKLAKSPNSS